MENIEKMTPPFWGLKIMNLLVFFLFRAEKKVFSGSWLWLGFGWGGVGRAFMQFMHFSAIFAMLAFLATLVTPWYPL